MSQLLNNFVTIVIKTMIDYYKIIDKYFKPGTIAYKIYITHVTLVTAKALRIGQRLDLSRESLDFIEEAGMLHDIGMVHSNSPDFGCTGSEKYHDHLIEGKKILLKEGLPRHAEVAVNHARTGLKKEDIQKLKYNLPNEDVFAESIEEKLISWADIFFSKNIDLWYERSLKEARDKIKNHGNWYLEIFDKWYEEFGYLDNR